MRVVLQYGSRVGEEVDLPPRNAQAMLADGRARPAHDDVSVVAAPGEPVTARTVNPAQIDARDDRGLPSRARRRR